MGVLCCCDSRKATIIFSLVALVLNILALIQTVSNEGPVEQNAWTIAAYSVSILFYILVVCGAIRYHRCMVFISLVWVITSMVFVIIGAVGYDWDSLSGNDKDIGIVALSIVLAWDLLVVYSLGSFIMEVGSGVMSPETHSREKYSCCCNV